MTRAFAHLGKFLTGAAKVRTIMLAYYAGIATGLLMAVAWVATLSFATPLALRLIQQVSGVVQ